jgi:WD40 repeat protein
VYEAYDPVMKRTVALKVAKQGEDHRRVERFLREARAAGLLTHPYIVAVFDSGNDGGKHYIASALVQGKPLSAVIEDGKALPAREAVEMARKLAEALAYAHRQGVIHRDVKPGNVMLRTDGEPLLMDFGLAARSGEEAKLTMAGQFMGTPAYAAPEQWRGQACEASDQYSLGCLLFELLAGRPPYRGRHIADFMALHAEAPVPALPGVPGDLETITRKCMEKEPQRRYPDCQELADDLARFLRGEPTRARPLGPLGRLWRWAKREPVTASLVGAVGLLLAGTVVALLLAFWALEEKARANLNEAEAARKLAKQATENEGLAKQRQKEAEEAEERIREELARTEVALYAGQLAQAVREWKDNNAARAVEILEGCQWDLRGWEHRYLWALFHSNQYTLDGHRNGTNGVAFSPDGRRLASAGQDGMVRVRDALSGKELFTHEDRDWALAVAYSPDGKRLASGGADELVKVRDAQTGKVLHVLKGHTDHVRCVAFSPDGGRIASASGPITPLDIPRAPPGEVIVWDTRKGQKLLTLRGHARGIHGLAYSPDGRRIVSGSVDGTLRVWDADKGQEQLTLKGHTHWVNGVAYSPDGRLITSGGGDATVRVWDASTGRELLTLRGHSGAVNGVAFSPDGGSIVSASDDTTVKAWDARTGQEAVCLKGHKGHVLCVAFGPEGRRIVSGSRDHTLKVWDYSTTQRPISFQAHPNGVGSVAFSGDGKLIVTASGRVIAEGGVTFDKPPDVTVWDAQTGRALLALVGQVHVCCNNVALSPDGKRIVSGGVDKSVKVWDAQTGKELLTLKGHGESTTCVAFSGDGRRIVSAGLENALKVWDADTGKELLTLGGHTDSIQCVAYSNDDKRIVSGAWDKTLKVWDANTGKELHTLRGHTDDVRSVAFSPDGNRIASASLDTTVRVWDVRMGRELLTLRGHTGYVRCVSYSPDGKRIVSGGDDALKLWDARTGLEVLTLPAAGGSVSSLAYSPSGNRLVTGSADGTLALRSAERGQKEFHLRGMTQGVTSVAFSADGKRLRSQDANGNRYDFDAQTGKPLPPDKAALLPNQKQAEQPGGTLRARGERWTIVIQPPGATEERGDIRVLDRSRDHLWHAAQAGRFEKSRQWPSVAFHLERLYRTSPDPGIRGRLLTALKQAEVAPMSSDVIRNPQFAIVPVRRGPQPDSPLIQAVKRNLQATDAARAASLVGNPGLLGAAVLPAPKARPGK